MDDQTKQCPQCKGMVSRNAQECPLCGVIFKRYEEARDTLNEDAISAYENGDLHHSKKLFERMIQSFPDLTDSSQIYLKKIEDQESSQLYEKASSKYKQGNLTDAKILFEDLIQHYPNSPNNDSALKYIKEIESKQMESESPTEQDQDSKEHQQTAIDAVKPEPVHATESDDAAPETEPIPTKTQALHDGIISEEESRSGEQNIVRMTVPNTAENKFNVLRFIVIAIKVLSIICGLSGGVIITAVCDPNNGIGVIFVLLLSTSIIFLTMWGFADVIKVLIDIEENTRNTVLKLYQADSSLCSDCGKYYSGNSAHCPNCGAKVST